MGEHRFDQIDVFGASAFGGNPVAVVHDADELTDEQMAAFARWTNLSETTFLLRPTGSADYRVRIFTPAEELPFAGHPTLGSCHAWLSRRNGAAADLSGAPDPGADSADLPRSPATVTQQCALGDIRLRIDGERIAFGAPPLHRCGQLEPALLERAAHAVGLTVEDVVRSSWLDNGPPWIGLQLADAAAVLAARVDPHAGEDLFIGLVGLHPVGSGAQIEVRALCPGTGVVEDPVTGSLNAGLGQWLIGEGILPEHYVAAQGTALGRTGRVAIDRDASGTVWVGGRVSTRISGTVLF